MAELTEKDRTPPRSAQAAAQKVLDWKEKHGDAVKGMTETGWNRARQIASGGPLSLDVIKKISQFARHEKNKSVDPEFKDEPWRDNGHVAWLGWGGDSAILEWSGDIVRKSEEKTNAKRHPEVYYCKHMYAGLAGYEDDTILVGLDAMKSMCDSFKARPLYVMHQDVNLETIESEADGWVSKCWYNEDDGWLWAEFIAVTDAAREAIDKGWSVSNAYVPTSSRDGGTYTNIPYDWEVLDADFTHLAIVPNPRYESAAILDSESFKSYMRELRTQKELKNSKEKRGALMKFFKTKKEEVDQVDSDTMVEITNDDGSVTELKVQDMINAVVNAKKNESEKDEEKINMETLVNVGDKEMTLKELISEYKNMCKKNAESEDEEKENESDEDDEKKNETEDDEKMNEDDEEKKENKNSKDSKHFKNLMNASASKSDNQGGVSFRSDRLKRGSEKY